MVGFVVHIDSKGRSVDFRQGFHVGNDPFHILRIVYFPSLFPVKCFPPIFRGKHYMILAIPFCVL